MSKLFVANWKMHKTIAQTQEFVQSLLQQHWPTDRQAVICAPFTALTTLRNEKLLYGAQTMHWEEAGAFTGEISAPMLTELHCRYVILGHSERRRDNNETNDAVHKKVLSALRHQLTPIICVGESLEQHKNNETTAWVTTQIQTALDGIASNQLSKLVIAYEPIWAIGTGITATPEQAQAVHAVIRALTSPATPIIYGGSVTPENIAALMQQPDINGALIGGASLAADSFVRILNYK